MDTSPAASATCQPSDEPDSPRYIVGIGASAGGLGPLERFFDHLPAQTGMAFVVVQHLSPDYKSLMPELLGRHTLMRIVRVEHETPVEPDTLYLIPPRKEMILAGGKLLLREPEGERAPTLLIDVFLKSLAAEVGGRSVGIILSGTGSDGSRGVRAVRDAGGFVLVQRADSAEFDGMPRSAIATQAAHYVVTPEEMPALLLQHAQDDRRSPQESQPPADADRDLRSLLQNRFGIDISNYRGSLIQSRLQRRVAMHGLDDLASYCRLLGQHPQEAGALLNDLLIDETRFFRDPLAWEALEAELGKALAELRTGHNFRVWVAGCGSGEEAYSLGMLLLEQARQADVSPDRLRVFATDVREEALAVAQMGWYSAAVAEDLSPARLEEFFTPRGDGGYQVSAGLRSQLTFATHDLFRDPPFTHLDLIVCRNLLMYLEPRARQRLLSLFHFGLRSKGLLLLGNDETCGDDSPDFSPVVDVDARLYQKTREASGLPPVTLAMKPGRPVAHRTASALTPRVTMVHRFHDALLKRFAPPCLLLNSRREIVHIAGDGGRFLVPLDDGHATLDVASRVVPELRTPVTTALQRVGVTGLPVTIERLACRLGDQMRSIRLVIEPLPGSPGEEQGMLVCFETVAPTLATDAAVEGRSLTEAHGRIGDLEEQLLQVREHLQSTVEELEASNEELQATNEELQAANEEMQTTNEELQATNEELVTVNSEYQRKHEELVQANSDMDILLSSTEIGTVFLDDQLRIRKFTAQAMAAFNVDYRDIGRPLEHLTHSLQFPDLHEALRRVLETGQSESREILNRDGSSLLVRLHPCKGTGAAPAGVVITLVDVSALVQARFQLARMAAVFMDGVDPILILDTGGRITELNRAAQAATGWSAAEALGRPATDCLAAGEREAFAESVSRALAGQEVPCRESSWQDPTGRSRPVLLTVGRASADGRPLSEVFVIARDIRFLKEQEQRLLLSRQELEKRVAERTEELQQALVEQHRQMADRERAEKARTESEGRLKAILDNATTSIFAKDLEGRYILANPRALALLRPGGGGLLGRSDHELLPEDEAETLRGNDLQVLAAGRAMEFEETLGSGASVRTFLTIKFPLFDAAGRASGVGAVATDITERKREEHNLRRSRDEMEEFAFVASHDLQEPLRTIRNYSDLLRKDAGDALNPTADRDLEFICSAAQRMQNLIDDLLKLSRASVAEIRYTSVPLRECVQHALHALDKTIMDRHAEIHVADLPIVPGDATLLTQLFQNLISNAVKFCKDHTPLVEITCEPSGSRGWVIGVRDNGIGIRPEFHDKIFLPFKRLHGGNRFEGNGIGLTICRKVIDRHHGRIWVESEPGRGAHFQFLLPATVDTTS